MAKVEWHPGELVPRVGFIVTNLSRPTKRVAAFYNHRGTAEQHIKEGKNAINWTRLSCRKFRNNAVRLQALAYNRIARAAAAAGVEKLVHISAIGADAGANSAYARSKAAGEQALREAYPQATILQIALGYVRSGG